MTIRRFKAQLAAVVTCVALVGCNDTAPVEPDASPASSGAVEEAGALEEGLMEGGADAALPPDQQLGEE